MSEAVRIIPRLDIKGPNLVKGIHLEGLRVLGKPADFAKFYYEAGADELLYVDIVASLYQRNSLDDLIRETAKTVFIPLTVGGGIRTLVDVKRILRAGADKVAINTAAISNPKFISQAVNAFGSSTIAVAIEALKQPDGRYLAFTDNGRVYTGVEVFAWAKEVERLGAGEIFITSIDQEGTGKGYDLKLTAKVAGSISIPVVACGGAGKLSDVKDVIVTGRASAAAMASVLHYDYITQHEKNYDKKEGNVTFLKSGRTFKNVTPLTVNQIKKYLIKNKIECRR